MKVRNLVLAAGAISLLACSCNNDDKNKTTEVRTSSDTVDMTKGNSNITTTTKTENTRHYSTRPIVIADLPKPITMSFAKEYPKASNIEWRFFNPADTMMYDNELYPDWDTSYYTVNYKTDATEQMTVYNPQGEWVETSTIVPIMGGNPNLPDAVNKTIRGQYPDYNIYLIKKDKDKSNTIYVVKLIKGDSKVKVILNADGSVYKSKSKPA